MTDATHHLELSRLFDAPRHAVYQAFVDPDQLAQWFGPVGYSVPRATVEIDARVGGYQRFVMVNDADPTQTSPINATFTDVVADELLAGSEEVLGVPGSDGPTKLSMRVEFHDAAGKTSVMLSQGPFTAEVLKLAGMGWESSFTKLDRLLAG